MIDCDAKPFVPNGWSVEEHQMSGQFSLNSAKIELYLSRKQAKGLIVGNDLRDRIKGRSVLNANVLDYLLAHPELIPNNWKGKYVFFWGTIYRDSYNNLSVRYLRCIGSEWCCDYYCLNCYFDSDEPCALAS